MSEKSTPITLTKPESVTLSYSQGQEIAWMPSEPGAEPESFCPREWLTGLLTAPGIHCSAPSACLTLSSGFKMTLFLTVLH